MLSKSSTTRRDDASGGTKSNEQHSSAAMSCFKFFHVCMADIWKQTLVEGSKESDTQVVVESEQAK